MYRSPILNPILVALVMAALALPALANSYYLTVAGLGGEEDYEQRFSTWANDMQQLLEKEPGATSMVLSGAESTKANIQARLDEIAMKATADDTFMLLLIGHGTFDGVDYKFNIPGRDISAGELSTALDKIKARQLVVTATSSSGGATPVLQKANRVMVTATKSGTEKNATVFGRYWVEAFRDAAADTDKNESLSALEAFNYAHQKVVDYFEQQKRLATEHALIEDTGSGDGVDDPSPENGQGLIAGRFTVLHLGSVADIVNDPAKQDLLKRKDELEVSIDELKYRKASMRVQDYNQQLRQYLVELAQVQAELDK